MVYTHLTIPGAMRDISVHMTTALSEEGTKCTSKSVQHAIVYNRFTSVI